MGLGDAFSSSKGIAAAGRSKKKTIRTTRKFGKQAIQEFEKTRAGATEGIEKYTGLAGQTLAKPLADVGSFLDEQRGYYTPTTETLLGSQGLRGETGAREAEDAYRLSLNPGRALVNENLLRLTPQGVGSGRAMTDLADYEFQTAYPTWQGGLFKGLQQFDPTQTLQTQGQLASNLANIYGNAGGQTANAFLTSNPANVYTNMGNTIAGAQQQFQTDKYGAQQGALANQWGAVGAGLNLAGNIAGQTVGGNTLGGKLLGKVFK
jgi:hypothetical protein